MLGLSLQMRSMLLGSSQKKKNWKDKEGIKQQGTRARKKGQQKGKFKE